VRALRRDVGKNHISERLAWGNPHFCGARHTAPSLLLTRARPSNQSSAFLPSFAQISCRGLAAARMVITSLRLWPSAQNLNSERALLPVRGKA
jgi:hypothetical protein